MNPPASLEGHERLRLFVALLLPPDVRSRIAEWQSRVLRDADVRAVTPENLHVTVAFLGSTDPEDLPRIATVVQDAGLVSSAPTFEAVRYRESRSVAMIVLDDLGAVGTQLADGVFSRLEGVGVYEREQRPWLPHITVARFKTRPRLRPEAPELGRFVSSELAVMISRLRRSGAQYDVLESVPLGG